MSHESKYSAFLGEWFSRDAEYRELEIAHAEIARLRALVGAGDET